MDEFQDGFSGELDAALRKSWSESQNEMSNSDEVEEFFRNGRIGNALSGLMNSPIGTPSNVSQYEMDLDTDDGASISTTTTTNAAVAKDGSKSGAPVFNENVGSEIVKNAMEARHSPSPHSSTVDTSTEHNVDNGLHKNEHSTHHRRKKSHRRKSGNNENDINEQNGDYQIFKHHYSMPDNKKESVTNILNDLNLGSGSAQEDNINQGSLSHRKRSSHSMSTARRSSVQDIQWMRQLLNPRSSFSGASMNEPPLTTKKSGSIETSASLSTTSTSSSDNTPTKCWVTVIDRDEIIPAVVVLHHTIRASNSKYDLVVLHPHTFDPTELHNRNITSTIAFSECVSTDLHDPALQLNSEEETRTIIANWNKLSIFLSLVGLYDLVCYISPSCMVLQNIDDLLDSQEIFAEIDNEMCVLLTNQDSKKKDEKDPQIILLKPNNEVAMCIREFFTVYSNSAQEKKNKLMKLKDLDVLKELFGDTWGFISTDSYCKTLQVNETCPNSNSMLRIIDFKRLAPWEHLQEPNTNEDTLCSRWLSTFRS